MNAINRAVRGIVGVTKAAVETAAVTPIRFGEEASSEEQQLDALRRQNGHRYMTSGERAKRVQACITNMTADQIRAKLAQVQGKPDPGAKDWVAVYTEALAKKG